MSDLTRHRTQYGAGKVHLVRPCRVRFHVVLYCTGRAVSGSYPTDEAVECKACIKRAKREGVET